MKEIEVKAKVKNKEAVISELKKIGCEFAAPIVQVDTCYAHFVGTVDEYLKSDHFLRIRQTNDGKYVFTVKQPMDKTASKLSKLEHETEIKDADEMEKALLLMGYKKANRVKKSRQTTHFKDYEICLDEVDELGLFIEIEKFAEDDPDATRKEIFDFLISLGISKEDEVKKGYDLLIMANYEK